MASLLHEAVVAQSRCGWECNVAPLRVGAGEAEGESTGGVTSQVAHTVHTRAVDFIRGEGWTLQRGDKQPDESSAERLMTHRQRQRVRHGRWQR